MVALFKRSQYNLAKLDEIGHIYFRFGNIVKYWYTFEIDISFTYVFIFSPLFRSRGYHADHLKWC